MSRGEDPIGVIQFTDATEKRDIDALENIVSQRWHYETEICLDRGEIEVYRNDEL